MKRLFFIVCTTALALAVHPGRALAQTPSIEYTLSVRNPLSHLYSIEIEVTGARSTSLDFAMPAWSPGVYLIRDFSGNVQEFGAVNKQNRTLQVEQTDKQTWRVSKSSTDDVRVHYRVYSSGLNDEMADITPAAVFMYVVGQTGAPVSVRYLTEGNWKVHSPLEKRGDRYVARDYDSLAQSPAFLGEFKVLEFKSGTIPIKVVFSNPRIQMTALQVETDLTDLAEAATMMFGTAPFKDFTFLVKVQPTSGASSVGYPNSSRIFVGENDFVNQTSYTAFLAAAAQGLAKAWYGIAARPRSMTPYDFSREAYSRNFWFTEGVAVYSAELLLLRSNILISAEFFARTTGDVDALQHQAGRLVMSLQDSSWNTWTRSENSANAVVNYLLKGKIAGLLLDAEIRSRTSGSKGLEDAVKGLISQAATRQTGLDDNALEAAIQTTTGVDVREFFDNIVRGKGEIDYKRYLERLGVSVSSRKAPPTIFLGIEFDRTEASQARIRRVIPGSPAEAAKLDSGDILLAMDSERITFDNLASRIHSKPLGKPVTLAVMRGERLLTLTISPGLTQTETWDVSESPNTTAEQLRLRTAWSGLTKATPAGR